MTSDSVTNCTGNVFADIEVKNPEEALVKAKLAHVIARDIEARQLTQLQAAQLLGIDQPKVSNLVRGKLSGFSIDRLFRFLMLLGSDIEIVVKDKPGKRVGHIKVAVG